MENEKRSLFGKFKAKLAQALDADNNDVMMESSDPHAVAVAVSSSERSRSSVSLSPEPSHNKNKREETTQHNSPPFSPMASGLPPSIPEEPAVVESEQGQEGEEQKLHPDHDHHNDVSGGPGGEGQSLESSSASGGGEDKGDAHTAESNEGS